MNRRGWVLTSILWTLLLLLIIAFPARNAGGATLPEPVKKAIFEQLRFHDPITETAWFNELSGVCGTTWVGIERNWLGLILIRDGYIKKSVLPPGADRGALDCDPLDAYGYTVQQKLEPYISQREERQPLKWDIHIKLAKRVLKSIDYASASDGGRTWAVKFTYFLEPIFPGLPRLGPYTGQAVATINLFGEWKVALAFSFLTDLGAYEAWGEEQFERYVLNVTRNLTGNWEGVLLHNTARELFGTSFDISHEVRIELAFQQTGEQLTGQLKGDVDVWEDGDDRLTTRKRTVSATITGVLGKYFGSRQHAREITLKMRVFGIANPVDQEDWPESGPNGRIEVDAAGGVTVRTVAFGVPNVTWYMRRPSESKAGSISHKDRPESLPAAEGASPNPVLRSGRVGEFRHGTLVTKNAKGELELAPSPAHATHTHSGVDLVADCGGPIHSLSDGYVVDAIETDKDKDFPALGYMVIVKHKAPMNNKETYSVYFHMHGPPKAAVGQEVKGGVTVLGEVGATGAASGCHTHFEIRHFRSRYFENPEWNQPWNIYGKGDQRNTQRFHEAWEDPLPVLSQRLQGPTGSESQLSGEGYIMLSKRGARWEYSVSWEFYGKQVSAAETRTETGTLTIINDGDAVFDGTKATRFSWTFQPQPAYKMNIFLVPSSSGVVLIGSEVISGNSSSREAYQPPLPLLMDPLSVGGTWNYKGLRIGGSGAATPYEASNAILGEERISVPAGEFNAIKLSAKDSSGSSTEWWTKNVGLVKRVESAPTHRMVAELVRYSIP